MKYIEISTNSESQVEMPITQFDQTSNLVATGSTSRRFGAELAEFCGVRPQENNLFASRENVAFQRFPAISAVLVS